MGSPLVSGHQVGVKTEPRVSEHSSAGVCSLQRRQTLGLVVIYVYAVQVRQLEIVDPFRVEGAQARAVPIRGLASGALAVDLGKSRGILVSSSCELLV